MGFWIALLGWGAWWAVKQGWWLMGHDWVWTGLLLALAGLLVLGVCSYGVVLVMKVLTGRVSVRLAKRDFRDALANLFMFAKTGLWKE